MQVIDVEAKVILHYDSLYGSSTLSECTTLLELIYIYILCAIIINRKGFLYTCYIYSRLVNEIKIKIDRKFIAQCTWDWPLQDFHIEHPLQERQKDGRCCGEDVCLVGVNYGYVQIIWLQINQLPGLISWVIAPILIDDNVRTII